MFNTALVGTEQVSLEDFSDFEATPSSFELIDIQNETASIGKLGMKFIDAPGYFIYRLSVPVDTQAAYDKRLLGFRVEVFTRDPRQRNPIRIDLGQHATQMREAFSSMAQYARETSEEPVVSADCPIDVALPNDNVFLSSTAQSFTVPTISSAITFSEPLETSNARSMAPTFYSPPGSDARTNTTNYFTSLPTNNPSTARNSMTARGIDAAAVVSSIASNSVQNLTNSGIKLDSSAFNAAFDSYFVNRPSIPANSISLQPSYYSLRDKRRQIAAENVRSDSLNSNNGVLVASIISNLDARQFDAPNRGISAVAGYVARMESRVKNYEYVFRIPKDKLSIRQYVYFSITPNIRNADAQNIISKSSYYEVAHKSQLLELLVPVLKPKIERRIDRENNVSFVVEQMDPTADLIKITKRVVNPTTEDDGHQLFASYDLQAGLQVIINDNQPQNLYPKNVIYRAIAGQEDKDGPFASITFEGKKPISFVSYESDISIQATNVREGIKLEIEKFPIDAIAVSLNRVNESLITVYKNKIKTIENESGQSLFLLNSNSKLEILDRDVLNNFIYRYFCTIHYPYGSKNDSVEDVIIKRKSSYVLNDPFDVIIDNGNLQIDDNGSVSYAASIVIDPKKNTFDFIKSLFESQKAIDEFKQFIGDNKDRISDLAVFKVRRVDKTIGKRYEMGLIKAGEFKDYDKQSRNLRIPPLKRGHSYTYVFTLCLLKPSSILFDIFSKASSGKIPGQNDIVFNPLLFDERTIRENGALPSNYSLSAPIDFGKAISDAETSMSYRIDISVPKLRTTVQDFRISSNSRNTILYWKLEGGNISDVDHCIVKVNTNGTENVLASSVSSGANGIMMTVDDRYHNALGNRNYSITIVYTDGSESVPVVSETLVRRSTASDQLLASMIERGDARINGEIVEEARRYNSVPVPTANISNFFRNNQ